jgi:hypothetical protein
MWWFVIGTIFGIVIGVHAALDYLPMRKKKKKKE